MYRRFILLFLISTPSLASEIKPFTSDGCSAFPDGTFRQQSLWSNCCFLHDLAYWKGGTEKQKNTADGDLELCVKNVGAPHIAKLMLAGVKVGGSPVLNTPFRWGYGWPYGRGYKALSRADKLQVAHKLEVFKIIIDHEIKQITMDRNEAE
ncbi:MAG: FAD-binding oxidoreductase [Gammaproteobacteria bacterium]|nr:FAD-binding oxidoreductase [Gammaproteobacteria bacterium]